LRGEKDIKNKRFSREYRIEQELRFYEDFNNHLVENSRGIKFIEFETLTSTPQRLLQTVASMLNTNYVECDLERFSAEVVASIEKYESRLQVPAETSALPQSEKKEHLEEVKSLVLGRDYEDILNRCLLVYGRLTASIASPETHLRAPVA
jgi:hypothetical protein